MVLVRAILQGCAIGLMVRNGVALAIPIDTRAEQEAQYLKMPPDDGSSPTPNLPEGLPHHVHPLTSNSIHPDGAVVPLSSSPTRTVPAPSSQPSAWSEPDSMTRVTSASSIVAPVISPFVKRSNDENIGESKYVHPAHISGMGPGPVVHSTPVSSLQQTPTSNIRSIDYSLHPGSPRLGHGPVVGTASIWHATPTTDTGNIASIIRHIPNNVLAIPEVSKDGPGQVMQLAELPVVNTMIGRPPHLAAEAEAPQKHYAFWPVAVHVEDSNSHFPPGTIPGAMVPAAADVDHSDYVPPPALPPAGPGPVMPSNTTQKPHPIRPFPPGYDWRCHHADNSSKIPQYICSRPHHTPKETGARPCFTGIRHTNTTELGLVRPTLIPPPFNPRPINRVFISSTAAFAEPTDAIPLYPYRPNPGPVQSKKPDPTPTDSPDKEANIAKRYHPYRPHHRFNETGDVTQLVPPPHHSANAKALSPSGFAKARKTSVSTDISMTNNTNAANTTKGSEWKTQCIFKLMPFETHFRVRGSGWDDTQLGAYGQGLLDNINTCQVWVRNWAFQYTPHDKVYEWEAKFQMIRLERISCVGSAVVKAGGSTPDECVH